MTEKKSKNPALILTVYVFSLILLGGCSLMSPKPLDEQSMMSHIEQNLKSQDAKVTITVEELTNRKTDGKTDTVEARVLSDTNVAKGISLAIDQSDKPALRVESL